MKKTTLFLSAFLLLTTYCFSQDKGYIAISGGTAMPVGEYASSDVSNPKAGLAKTGVIYDLSFAYKLGKSFGLSAVFRGQSNAVNTQTFLDELTLAVPDAKWTIDCKNWSVARFMFGGYGSFPIGQSKTTFETKAMIGFLSASSPALTVTGLQSGVTAWVDQSSVTATTFTYLIGMGFKFNVASKVCLLANVDYTGGTPEFKNIKTTTSDGTFGEFTTSQSMETINVSVGVGFRL